MSNSDLSFGPNPLGIRISELKEGDEIIILKGEGSPEVAVETVTVVWMVDGFYALCADGTSISCWTVSDFIKTGRHFDQVDVSNEAWEVALSNYDTPEEQKDIFKSNNEPDFTVPVNFPSEPE